ncbi:MAG: sensor domain-containing diguanylate cyclase [Bacilli bacterium]
MEDLQSLHAEISRLRALNRLLQATRDSLHTPDILNAVRDHIGKLVDFDRFGLLVAEPRGKYCIVHELVTKTGLNFCPPGSIMPIAGTAIEWVFSELRTQVNHDLAQKKEFLEDETLYGDQIRSIVRVPLFKSGMAFGIMTVKSMEPNHFSEADIAFLEDVGLQLSSALYVSKLVMELKFQASTDALTGVFNRRALHEIRDQQGLMDFLEEFVIDHDFEDIHSVAVLLIDLDDFKLYNDQYGHDEGDRRLVAFTQILRYATPGHQLIFRYGGDEFVIVLPNALEIEAHNIASHIRQTAYKNGDHRGQPMSVSIGVKHDAWEGLSNLIREADAVMYDNKRRRQPQQPEAKLF